tara:strand:+ start:3859 stop:4056 length:198 start_codon:yes stop_codon:yes gene_type:complete
MIIIRRCPITGVRNKQEINVTEEQVRLWHGGTLIQEAMPNLTASEREFIMTGIIDEVWDTTVTDS